MITLRDYQQEAVKNTLASFEQHRSTMVVMPTGTGKTATAASLMAHWDKPGDILFLAHRKELLHQTAKTYHRLTGEVSFIEQAEYQAPERSFHGRRVIVGSVQTLQRKRLQQNRSFDPDRFSLIVIDECHHSPATSYLNILHHFGVVRHLPDHERNDKKQKKNFQLIPVDEGSPIRVLGLTATPHRTDEQSMGQIFSDCAYQMDIWTAIEEGWLVPVTQRTVKVESLNLDGIKLSKNEHGEKDFAPGELEKIMMEEKHLHEVADSTLQECGQRQGIIFAAGVTHAKLLKEVISRRKREVIEINGATDPRERKLNLDRFQSGEVQFLVNVGIATEGFDHPPTAAVIMARPTKSLLVYTQMLGRGTRPLTGCVDGLPTAQERRSAIAESAKPNTLVLDFVGNSKHKLVSSIDVLGGKYSARLLKLAGKKLQQKGGGTVDEAIEEAKEEIILQICSEVRKTFVPTAVYLTEEISPFKRHVVTSLVTQKPPTPRGSASEGQINFLVKLGVDRQVAMSWSKKQAGIVIDKLKRTRCTTGQAYHLSKAGYDPKDYNVETAGRLLNQILKPQGAGA